MPGYTPRNLNHFSHTETSPGAEVVDQPAALRERVQCEHVRRSQVEDVDVVPNATAILSGVVRSEDRNSGTLAERYFQNQRNQVGFRRMVFAQVRAGRAGCVEIAQARVA